MMKGYGYYVWILIALWALFGAPVCCQAQQESEEKKKVVPGIAAYLPDYRSSTNVNVSASHLTDLILFSIDPHSRGMIGGCCLLDHHYELGQNAQKHNPNLNVWVTIGGSGRSDAFSTIAADKQRRTRLIDAMVRLCQQHNLYGIDLDTFAPTTQLEYDNYRIFIYEASKTWHEHGIKISIAWHPNRFILPFDVFDLVDRINLMSYDMITEPNIYHATIKNTKKGVEKLIENGCPINKIWLGIPCYGRSRIDPNIVETFADLHSKLKNEKEYYNIETAYNHKGLEWDSRQRVRQKVHYAYSKQLGGIFFWELGQDYQDPKMAPGGLLLEAASMYRKKLLLSSSSIQSSSSDTITKDEL